MLDPLLNPPPSQVEEMDAVRKTHEPPNGYERVSACENQVRTSPCSETHQGSYVPTFVRNDICAGPAKDVEAALGIRDVCHADELGDALSATNLHEADAASSVDWIKRLGERVVALSREKDSYLAGMRQASERMVILRSQSETSEQERATERREDGELYQKNVARLLAEKKDLLDEVEMMQRQKDELTEALVTAHRQQAHSARLQEEMQT